MPISPWRKVIEPREDLQTTRSLDSTEFAVHLDQVRDNRAPDVYRLPEQFFERTFLTQNLTALSAETIRRLSGINTGTSPVFNLATQFGGGKTHALTLLYHLANAGPKAAGWMGVERILEKAEVGAVPKADVAVFVGTQFDSVDGRGGDDGTPLRKSPWGEIAFQLGGAEAFAAVAKHDAKMTAPGGDVIRKFLPEGKPCLILLDEIINYASRFRKNGWGDQLYNFMHNLSEEARGRSHVVVVASIPKSELEMTADDQTDYQRFDKMLNRLGKPIMMSAEEETSEIIRRRLFEWDSSKVSQSGKVILPKEAIQTCNEYADWVQEYRRSLPAWFPFDHAREAFAASYPFHPSVISVFERKWQALPQFQRTRGVLQLLAIWVARAFEEGTAGRQKDPLITLGTAPLDDPNFRTAIFEQLGEQRLEAVVTTDIAGKAESHSVRLDNEAVDAIKKARLHRKAATAVFFESNGGQLHAEATLPEIRIAVGEPSLDIGNVETVLETLVGECDYLRQNNNRYYFSPKPGLNKLVTDRRASIAQVRIDEEARKRVQTVFNKGQKVERKFFPTESGLIPNRAALTFVVLPPDQPAREDGTLRTIEKFTRECGGSGRTYKSALIWCVAESADALYDEARELLALQHIRDEYREEDLGSDQWPDLARRIKRAEADLEEGVWRAYRYVFLLDAENEIRQIDLGMPNSSSSTSLIDLIIQQLRSSDELLATLASNFLLRNWPADTTEWSTRALRDAFFASPRFPRLMHEDVIKETIRNGVSTGALAYVTKDGAGRYSTFEYQTSLNSTELEFNDDTYIMTREAAEAYRKQESEPKAHPQPVTDDAHPEPETRSEPIVAAPNPHAPAPEPTVRRLTWAGEVSPLKWMTFYNKVLSRFTTGAGMRLRVSIEIEPAGGIPKHMVEETKVALRELGLGEDVGVE